MDFLAVQVRFRPALEDHGMPIDSALVERIEPEIAALAAKGRHEWKRKLARIDIELLASVPLVQARLARPGRAGRIDPDARLKAIDGVLEVAIKTLPSRYRNAALEHFGYTDPNPDSPWGKTTREKQAASKFGVGERSYRKPSNDYFGMKPGDYVIAVAACAFCGIADPIAYIARRRKESDTEPVPSKPRADQNGGVASPIEDSTTVGASDLGLASPSATMVSRDPEHLEVFWTGPNNEVLYRWWEQPHGWSDVESWAEPEAVCLAAVSQEEGDEILFGLAPDGRVWYRVWERTAEDSYRAGEVQWLDGVVRGPLATASRGPGVIELFAFDARGQPCHRWTEEEVQWVPWTSDW